ncbi:uncharacterized protein [Apostichopus japonicus]|uniref:uncharacterized protein n=1 Tax=Stichopus japonicus TaxID=307972 RepID=UPI003AB2A241
MKMSGSRLPGWFQLLLFTILLLPIITAAKPSNLARIIGPLMGKRGETEGFENDIMNRIRAVQDQESDILARTGLDDSTFTCPLDTLFLSLEPQWQDLILQILRLASYEEGWTLK